MERLSGRRAGPLQLDYGESDRLVTFLTRDRGKLTAFAGGARKSKRRFAGALEPFMLLRIHWVERRGTTVRLDTVDVQHGFYPVREDLARISRALYCVELVPGADPRRTAQPGALRGRGGLAGRPGAPPGGADLAAGLRARCPGHGRADAALRRLCPLWGAPRGAARLRAVATEAWSASAASRGRPRRCPWTRGWPRPWPRSRPEGASRCRPQTRARARALLNLFIAHHLGGA